MGYYNSLEFYQELICALRSDIALSDDPKQELRRDIEEIRNRCATEGLGFLTKTLPRFGKAIDKSLSKNIPLSIEGFATRDGVPLFLGVFLRRMFDQEGRERSDASPLDLRSIRQLTYFMYKAELPYTKQQEVAVMDRFKSVEEELALATIDYHDPIIARARIHVTRLFAGAESAVTLDAIRSNGELTVVTRQCVWDNIIPGHGPGSVATGEWLDEKFTFRRVYKTLDSRYPFMEYFRTGFNHVCDNYHDPLEVLDTPTAKVLLVPKDSRGPRLISCEPLEIQWIQQGLMREMTRIIESSYPTRGYVNFEKQSINREMARLGSLDSEWVTLDMQDASDRVSLELVKAIFGGTQLLEALLASRSTSTRLPGGEIVQLNKFAPMGSATCFPVEALVFWSLAVASIQLTTSRSWKRIPEVFVYGDDVIVRRKDYPVVLHYLEKFHLKWNEAKCCTHGFFRESCGLDAYKGVEVTPLRYRSEITPKRDASQYKSLLSLTNRLCLAGYESTSDLLRSALVKIYGRIPYTSNEAYMDSFLYIHSPESARMRNVKVRKRISCEHKLQLRTLVPSVGPFNRLSEGWAAGLRALCSLKPAQSDYGQDGRKLRLSWKYIDWE